VIAKLLGLAGPAVFGFCLLLAVLDLFGRRSGEPMKMAMEGRAPKALIRRLEHWQKILRLQDWRIAIFYVDR
jgi:hypothetical protein